MNYSMYATFCWYHFSDEDMQDSDAFYERVTQQTDQRTQPIIEIRGRI